MDFLHGNPGQTTNTDLAAAMATFGIPLNQDRPVQVFVGDNERIAFYFETASPCGLYTTKESMALWDDPALDSTRPKHAMSYMRIALRSRPKLLDYAHRRARIGIATRSAGKFEIVRLTGDIPASAKVKTPRTPAPEAATTPRLQTDDVELASSLLSCGIPLWRDFPIEHRENNRLSFFFHPISPCGAFTTRELMLAWQDPAWHESNPEHPFAYLKCVFENRRRLVRLIRENNPMAVFDRGGYPHFLTVNASPEVEKSFMEELRKL